MAICWPTPGFKGRTFKLRSHRMRLISASAAPHCGGGRRERAWLMSKNRKSSRTRRKTILKQQQNKNKANKKGERNWRRSCGRRKMVTDWGVMKKRSLEKKMRKRKNKNENKSQLVSWWFEPSQPQRITSGPNTNFILSHIYSFHKPWYQKWCFLAYLYSAGTQHGTLHPAGWPILFCGPTQEQKYREMFWKKCMWMDRKRRNKQGKNPWQ